MPFIVVKDTSACPEDMPWAIKNEDTGKLYGCHASQASARMQQRALYASVRDARQARKDAPERTRPAVRLGEAGAEAETQTGPVP